MTSYPPLSLEQALAAARDTRRLVMGNGVLSQTSALFAELFSGCGAIIIADPRTFAAAGNEVLAALQAAGIKTLPCCIIDDPELYAESRFVEVVEAALREHEAIPVAVGSGTLNDLTKLAAHRCGRQYLCVATAASMDGYTAFGASITHEGSKQTFDCPAPIAVLADLDVIRTAPPEMTGWGYADFSAKITAGADWIIADALAVEPINAQAWGIVQGSLHQALSDPHNTAALVEGLMLGGFAMQATKSSRPASGAEHQFSHLWDMQHHTYLGAAPSHGAKVGIGTLAITALYEALFEMPLQEIDVDSCVAKWSDLPTWLQLAEAEFDSEELRTVAVRELTAKHSSREELKAQLERFIVLWPRLKADLQQQLIPFPKLKAMLQAAGAPTQSEEIGVTRERLRATFRSAFFIRRRFTVLDLAMRLGVLDSALDKVFTTHLS